MEFLKAFYQSQKLTRTDYLFSLLGGALLYVIALLVPTFYTVVLIIAGAFFALFLLLFLYLGCLYFTGGPDTRKSIIQGLEKGKEIRIRAMKKVMGKRPGGKG
jgi:ABC-type multidrug transport system permease subunit